MRLALPKFMSLAAALAVLAGPAAMAQQISPMTGTTASPPTMAPAADPAAAPTAPAAAPARVRRGRQTMQQRYEAANTTHDGKLTLEQARAGRMTRVVRNFDAIDNGKKGYVTLAEIHAFNKAKRAARKATP
ncbi:MAG: EF-hand domain-containing protein [Janthinobacterium lividum]